MENNRGSKWRKWDLHVHTPETKLNNRYSSQTEDVWESFCEKIEQSDVDVFGITDYFSINNYTKFIDKFRSKYPHSNKIFFPNVEFRMSDKNKDGEHIQFHIIFSNQRNIVDRVSDFLMRLPLISTDDHNLTSKYCCEADLTQIGYDKAMVKLDETISKLKENFSENDYIIVGLSSGYGSLRPAKNDPRGEVYAKEIDKKCGIFFGSSKDTNFYLNKIDGRKQYNLPPKPVLNGSDCHSFYDINEKLGKKYEKKDNNGQICDCSEITWIKADPTFEGLKQIIYEPEERVKIQENKPDEKEDKEIIDKVQFISPNNQFNNQEIHLNPNLNVIIGGKSSGKSILLYSIAKTLLPETKDRLLLNNDGSPKYDLKSIDKDFDFKVTTKAGISQKISERENGDNSVIPNIKYIPQNELVKLAEPELSGKGKSLNKLVRQLILEDSDSEQKYQSFIKNVKEYDKNREDLINNYFGTLDEIQELEAKLKTKSSKEVLETSVRRQTKVYRG
nr:ATP-binding protein [Ornithobacterium rhinotracheale]